MCIDTTDGKLFEKEQIPWKIPNIFNTQSTRDKRLNEWFRFEVERMKIPQKLIFVHQNRPNIGGNFD